MKEILKKFLYINIVLLITSFLTQIFSNKTEFINVDGVMYPIYLHIENYVLITLTLVTALYLLIHLIKSFVKSKNYYLLSLTVIYILLSIVLIPFVLDQTTYSDFVGLHIDKFIGLLFMLVAFVNLIMSGVLLIFNRRSL